MFNIPLYLYQGAPLPPTTTLYDYVLAEQGIIKRVSNPLVEAELLLTPLPAAPALTGLNLALYPLPPMKLKIPRIPGELLHQALDISRQDLSREVMFQIVYNAAAGYRLLQPRQTREDIWVRYTTHPQPDDLSVLDLHSHHTMAAFFSGQDDRDEQGGRFYAVMGRLNLPQPHLVVRLGLYGHWLPLDPDNLFSDITPFAPAPPLNEAWQVQVSAPPAETSGSFLRRFLPERWTT
jgi:PRTRC genetic system protein A